MSEVVIGSLFSGYGGLDMGVLAALGCGRVAWHAEIDAAPSKILAHRHPGVPNHGDVSAIDWDAVEPVTVLTGGFPCQDVSLAGLRAGLKAGAAVARWERIIGRAAPAPTALSEAYLKAVRRRIERRDKRPVGMRGSLKPRRNLSAVFVEWMMGLPLGWLTAPEVGLTRNEQLKALGNGVVPQQAALAVSILVADEAAAYGLAA